MSDYDFAGGLVVGAVVLGIIAAVLSFVLGGALVWWLT